MRVPALPGHCPRRHRPTRSSSSSSIELDFAFHEVDSGAVIPVSFVRFGGVWCGMKNQSSLLTLTVVLLSVVAVSHAFAPPCPSDNAGELVDIVGTELANLPSTAWRTLAIDLNLDSSVDVVATAGHGSGSTGATGEARARVYFWENMGQDLGFHPPVVLIDATDYSFSPTEGKHLHSFPPSHPSKKNVHSFPTPYFFSMRSPSLTLQLWQHTRLMLVTWTAIRTWIW